MFPLVFILTTGVWFNDRKVHLYVLPLSILGAIAALYQYLLQMRVFSESYAPCRIGPSCSAIDFSWFGFVTIPLLSFIAFVLITVLAVASRDKTEK